MYDMNQWEHVFKLDPNKEISDKDLEDICESGTDAIMVGGTDGVTLDQVLSLLASIRRYTVPVILEISNLESITPGYDYYFVPTVLNSTDKKWVMDLHHQAVKEYGEIMNWDEIMVEGYCILNPEAKAYQRTECDMPDDEDVVAYAQMAENMFKLPIFYMEYSGTYGNPELVEKVSHALKDTLLFYGGGIQSKEQAKEMKAYADVVIVGNLIYENKKAALKTVKAVKERE
ncbi:heptaprenylglyceryl phosphate synthase [Pontibacillus yanchengensis]|uniref:Heptaprenylglyceryl phosphate synthase n=2 Tax=Pontibacillus yanchengensis TaxID=462910 RepID=A0A6I5A593_9BACI|nr:heptaprenylglyceryl phosphate synthase [Pontibacillus yanchengensis]MYL35521.1 heptaprenylglyceryl phosphate synthase [Pontibacillus yanchengensis]MYL55539.1 heptaprenylglyceryl phosphate synthase [Pontibacillus yanchengensis]